MRGQTIFSLALVAFAATAYSAPLKVRTDDLLEAQEKREAAGVDALAGALGMTYSFDE
jgi:hypothetical protein